MTINETQVAIADIDKILAKSTPPAPEIIASCATVSKDKEPKTIVLSKAGKDAISSVTYSNASN